MENKDWTDILYILVAVAFGIIGKLAQRKNKTIQKTPETPVPETIGSEELSQEPRKSKSESFFDTIFDTVFEEEIPASVVDEQEKEQNSKEDVLREVQKQAVKEDRGITALLKKRDKEEEIEQLEKEKNKFDLRQAVIYSEILNRKYN